MECALNDFSIVFFMIGEGHLEHILCKGIDTVKEVMEAKQWRQGGSRQLLPNR